MPLNLESLPTPLALRPLIPMSDEELMRFSRDNQAYKIERNAQGEITIMSPVGGIGSKHEGYVYGMLFMWNHLSGKGVTFSPSAGFNLPDGSCLQPDGAWISSERWDTLTLKEQTGFPPLCPDFLIETRSASDSRKDQEAKMLLWQQNGAELAWLVDPIEATVTIYRQGQAPETLNRPATVQATQPVEGFNLDCTPLWPSE